VGNPVGKRTLGRPRRKRKVFIKMEWDFEDWRMEFANSSAQWRTMVLAVLKFHVLLPERKLHRLTN